MRLRKLKYKFKKNKVMMKKILLIDTTLVSAFIALFFALASMSENSHDTLASNDMQTSVQNASHASSHSIYRTGGVYPEP